MSEEAFIKFYDRYARPLYRHILFYSGNPDTAQDVVSASFLKLWEFIREGKRIRNFRALLYRTAKNTFLDVVRRKEYSVLSLEELLKTGWEPASADPVQKFAAADDVRVLRLALARLPVHYREILTLRYLDELSIAEIAEVTGKNSGTIYVSLYRGKRALEEALQKVEDVTKEI
jgi:RNA polymerase sigma-70 factor (ECF subfamily)